MKSRAGMLMAITTVAFLGVLLSLPVFWRAADPITKVLPANYGEAVFLREESHGKLNIVPAYIKCDGWDRLVILGGGVSGIYLEEGVYEFQVFSPEPYDDSSSRSSCRSEVLKVKIQKGNKSFVEAIPQPGDEKTPFTWTLRRID